MKQILAAVLVAVGFGAAVGAQQALKPGNGVSLPQVVTKVKPEYTPEAMRARIEGIVGLDVVVEANGSVGRVVVTRSLDPVFGLDQQAMKAMKQWTFKPGLKDGKAVAVDIDIQMNFTLK